MKTSKLGKTSCCIGTVASLCYMLILLTVNVECKDDLKVVYEWREIDFQYESPDERWAAIESHEFRPNNVIPFGLEVYGSRVFVTLPRWKDGIPASLAYLEMNETSSEKSPALIPFPSWEAHSLNETEPELVSPFRVRADRCRRLWVLDSRIAGVLEKTQLYGRPQLLVYDLHNDNLIRRHMFSEDQVKQKSFFANLAIDDEDCDDTFAYSADLGNPGLVVYSWKQDESWRVQHNYFHPDPMSGNYSIDGIEFQWDDGLYGLTLSKPQSDGYATLYFHPLSSTNEFAVSTMILRNKTLATSSEIYHDFKLLGSRGLNGQTGAEYLDSTTGVLFYALLNKNAVGCWNSGNAEFKEPLQDVVFMSKVDMLFPSEIKVDGEHNLWVLSNRLHEYIYNELYPTSVNFRILKAPTTNLIKDTMCETVTEIESPSTTAAVMTSTEMPQVVSSTTPKLTVPVTTKVDTSSTTRATYKDSKLLRASVSSSGAVSQFSFSALVGAFILCLRYY